MPTLEEQLTFLKNAGIELKPGVTVDDLLSFSSREDYETSPYHHLLGIMGDLPDRSDDIIHWDSECVDNQGVYGNLALEMQALCDDAFMSSDVQDFIDYDNGVGWLSFVLNGQTYKWDLVVDNDWIDGTIFTRFVELLAQQNTDKRFTYGDLGGQDFLIGCASPEELELLNTQTEIPFSWLT
mgnify:CR=1 FL=1